MRSRRWLSLAIGLSLGSGIGLLAGGGLGPVPVAIVFGLGVVLITFDLTRKSERPQVAVTETSSTNGRGNFVDFVRLEEAGLEKARKMLSDTEELSETEILEAGRYVQEIYQLCRKFQQKLATVSEQLISEKTDQDASYALMFRNQIAFAKRNSALFDTFHSQVGQQAEMILEATAYVQKIDELARRIARIANETAILAVNARIVAAGADGAGKGFGVVARELGTLTDEIRDTNRVIGKHASALGKDLPRISKTAADVAAQCDVLRDEIERQRKELATAFTELRSEIASDKAWSDEVTECASGLLTHLQFQDRLAQSLLKVRLLLEERHEASLARLQDLGASIVQTDDVSAVGNAQDERALEEDLEGFGLEGLLEEDEEDEEDEQDGQNDGDIQFF